LYQFDAAVSRVFSWSVFKKGRGFRVQGSGFRVQGSGFRVQGSGFRVQGSGFRVVGSGFRVQGSGLWWQLRCNIYGAMPEGKWIAGFPFGISKH